MLTTIRKFGNNKLDRLIRKEVNASRHINILGHYNHDTLIDKSGKLIQIIQLAGINGLTQSEADLDAYKNRRNSLLKSFSSEYAIYFWTLRRQATVYPGGKFKSDFAKQLNEKYQAKLQENPLLQNVLYLGLATKPASGIINQGFNWFNKLSHQIQQGAQEQQLAKTRCALFFRVLSLY